MKLTAFVLGVLLSLNVWAGQDSVGVFYRAEKTIVFTTENLYRSQRLPAMMAAFGQDKRLLLISSDNSLKVDCGASSVSASCTFRFFPSDIVDIGNKNVEARFSLAELGITQAQDFEMSFESSMADRFILSVKDGHLYLYAHKRNSDKYQR